MVFYFTGTGNSLYIAKQLDENPVSIHQEIHQKSLEFTSDRIGVVAPVYGHEVPDMVKEFLKAARFHTDYFYMILTYGNRHGGAAGCNPSRPERRKKNDLTSDRKRPGRAPGIC